MNSNLTEYDSQLEKAEHFRQKKKDEKVEERLQFEEKLRNKYKALISGQEITLGSMTFTIVKDSEGWYISNISCFDGELFDLVNQSPGIPVSYHNALEEFANGLKGE